MGKIHFPVIYHLIFLILIFMGDNSNLRLNDYKGDCINRY